MVANQEKGISMKRVLPLVVIASSFLLVPACREKPLFNPGRIEVTAGSREGMRNAIGQALRNRGWAIAKEEPGRIEATLYARSHVARVAIEYDDTSFNIMYLDSENLDYMQKPDGAEFIHSSYNGWVENLVRDISVFASHEG
jgi:hypothetical protein